MNIAVGLFDPFDPETLQDIDPSYGRIKISTQKWEPNDIGYLRSERTELKSHKCSSEELGLTESPGKFWEIKNGQDKITSLFQHLFLCVDQAELLVYGQYGRHERGQSIHVDIVKCAE